MTKKEMIAGVAAGQIIAQTLLDNLKKAEGHLIDDDFASADADLDNVVGCLHSFAATHRVGVVGNCGIHEINRELCRIAVERAEPDDEAVNS